MKNKYVSTRIMAMVMAAAMTVSAAPAVYAAERADSETIKEDNQPAAEDSTESADIEDSSAEATKTEYPLTITTYDYDGNEIETTYEKAPEKVLAVYQGSIETMLALGLEDHLVATAGLPQVLIMKFRKISKKHSQKQIILTNLPHPLKL